MVKDERVAASADMGYRGGQMEISIMVDSFSTIPSLLEVHVAGYFKEVAGFPTVRQAPTDYLMIWVLDGAVVGTIEGESFRAEAGDLLVFEPGVAHSYAPASDRGWRWAWAHFGGTAASGIFRELREVGSVRTHIGANEILLAKFLNLASMSRQIGISGRRSRMGGELLSILGLIGELLSNDQRGGRMDLSDLDLWITENLAQKVSLKALSERSGYSSSHFSRLFSAAHGESPIAYVSRKKLENAAWLLEQTDLSVANVGRAVGFDDAYHFSRRFRDVYRLSPSHFRARHRPCID